MVVLEQALKQVHTEIDMVTTPSGEPVAMVHCNNCTSDINAWVNLFGEFADYMGFSVDTGTLFTKLFQKQRRERPIAAVFFRIIIFRRRCDCIRCRKATLCA